MTVSAQIPSYILAIDQGTTSSRALIFDHDMRVCAQAQQEFEQFFPQSGWVEHDAEEIWQSVLKTITHALSHAKITAQQLAGIGITNQRETIVAWDKKTGAPAYRALVWQDRRTAAFCQHLKEQGLELSIQEKTGLLLDPYFSASKIKWLLENVEAVKTLLAQERLCVGTIDSYLIARLSANRVHVSDVTNASRTQIFNIHTLKWDQTLLDIFAIPQHILPEVKACDAHFAWCDASIFGHAIPICGVAGDQQAALIGQACFDVGQVKSTYGTGCFALLNIGEQAVVSKNRLLTTIAYQIDDTLHYALEGSIFIAGAAVQWLRDGLKIIKSASESEERALEAATAQGLFLVPAFTGMGAPYWNADARGALFGLTRATGVEDICRAALASIAYQTADLFDAMAQDILCSGHVQMQHQRLQQVRVDGGMTENNWLMQYLADMLNLNIEKPHSAESTVMGAAYLAGKHLGLYPDVKTFASNWFCDKQYTPQKDQAWREKRLQGWKSAVASTLNFQVHY